MENPNAFWFESQPISQTDPLWIGLCGAYCLVRNWPLCTESLEVASRFLLSIFAQPSVAALNGVIETFHADRVFTFALKEQGVSRHAYGRMHAGTTLRFTNCLQSSQTLRT